MMFQKRIDRAFDLSKRKQEDTQLPGMEYDPRKPSEQPALSDVMEKGDMPAIIFSALAIILPVALVAVLLLGGAGLLLLYL